MTQGRVEFNLNALSHSFHDIAAVTELQLVKCWWEKILLVGFCFSSPLSWAKQKHVFTSITCTFDNYSWTMKLQVKEVELTDRSDLLIIVSFS